MKSEDLNVGSKFSHGKQDNRWAADEYPKHYIDVVKASISFTGLDVDMFTRGKAEDVVLLLGKVCLVSAEKVNFLDIGCGVGIMHSLLAECVGSLCGCDISEEAIKQAEQSNHGNDYRVQTAKQLPYGDSSFDFCSTVCVMHHVPPSDWRSFVAEAFRVTRPGGLFAVYEHNPFNPMTRWAVWRCPFDHDAVLLRMRRVQELLKDQGFEIVTRRYLFFIPLDRSWARKLDRLLSWLPLGAQYVVCGRKPVASPDPHDPA